ncbi:MAG: hypothetical protein MI810_14735 [Flavobacteriales bacterium]|nr:hypothetical protein [Flavobacteriales bacterium]
MAKIYTEDLKTKEKETKMVKEEVIKNILAFSKSYEVLKKDSPERKSGFNKNVELILN